jgi:hypothetical protein
MSANSTLRANSHASACSELLRISDPRSTLAGPNALVERIQKVFCSHLEWGTCSELARRSV